MANIKAAPHNWARAIRERFCLTTRRDFAGIMAFISRNHNEVVGQKIREAPKPQLCGVAYIKNFESNIDKISLDEK